MTIKFAHEILPETAGLQLCKIVGDDDLKMAEPVLFENGRDAVITTLNRASISGEVGGEIDKTTRYWADQLDEAGDHIGEIRLDQASWNSLKNHWMRCKMQP